MARTIVSLVTTLGADGAGTLARVVLDDRLAACVQADPVVSRYRWRDAIETADEVRLTMKTAAALADRLAERVAALHPYDVPQISWSRVEAADSYADWVESETA